MTDPNSTPGGGRLADLIGQQIGNYRIEALLGTGGMGQVFRARHVLLDRPAALKLMHSNLARDPAFQARFRQEAKSAAALRHPHIVEVFDFDEQDGHAYLVMELITGGSMRNLLQDGGRANPELTLALGLDLVRQAADALAYAHALGMVHRDIKPDNLLLQTNPAGGPPILKVGDFGLARMGEGSGLTAANTAMGTPAYMSPEQCQGKDLDGRSDIYALGVVLFEIATGTLPFSIKTVSEAVFKHVYTMPPAPRSLRPDLPEALDALIMRCLAKTPEERFASAADLAAALREVLAVIAPESSAGSSVYALPAVSTQSGSGTAIQAGVGQAPHVSTLPGSASLPRVQVLDENGTLLQVVAVRPGGMSIGRMPANDVQLDAPSVSRHHLQVTWDGARVMVTDLGSRSGTQLGDAMLTPQSPQEWPAGTMLRVGQFWMRLDPPADSSVHAGAAIPGLPSASMLHSFVSSGRLSATLDQDVITLTPGRTTTVEVTLSNSGTTPDQVGLSVVGVPEEWVTLPPVTQVDPSGQAVARVSVNVPEEAGARAGEYPVEVRARSRSSPTEGATALARWSVAPFVSVALSIAPARLASRTRGRYRVTIRNEGNAPVTYRLSAADDEGVASCAFDEEHLTVEPGASETVGMRVDRGTRLIGSDVQSRIEVRAQSPEGAPPQSTMAAYIHQPLIPTWIGGGIGILFLLGVIGSFAGSLMGGSSSVTPTVPPQPAALAATGAAQTQTAVVALEQTATTDVQAIQSLDATATALQATVVAEVDQGNATQVAAQQAAQAQQTAQAQQGQDQAQQTAQAQQGQDQAIQTQTALAQQQKATQTAIVNQQATAAIATQTAVANQGFAVQTAVAVTQTSEAQVIQQTQQAVQQNATATTQALIANQTATAVAQQTSVAASATAAVNATETAVAQAATATAESINATETAIAAAATATAAAEATGTSIAATATASVPNEITSTTFSPSSPGAFPPGVPVSIAFTYSANDPNSSGVRIWMMPYSSGSFAPGCSFSGSGVYPNGYGNGNVVFTCNQGGVVVDSVRILMASSIDSNVVLYERYLPVNYIYILLPQP